MDIVYVLLSGLFYVLFGLFMTFGVIFSIVLTGIGLEVASGLIKERSIFKGLVMVVVIIGVPALLIARFFYML